MIDALQEQLARGEILLTNLRITDLTEGDVEINVVVLFPDLGAAVIETKGARFEFREGEWTTNCGNYSRRIPPINQARKGKHVLRRVAARCTHASYCA